MQTKSIKLYYDLFSLVLYGASLFFWKFSEERQRGKFYTIIMSFLTILLGSILLAFGIWLKLRLDFSIGINKYHTFAFSFTFASLGFMVIGLGLGGLKASLLLFGFDQLEKKKSFVIDGTAGVKIDVEYLPDYSFIRAFYFITNLGGLMSYALTFLHEQHWTINMFVNLEESSGYAVSAGLIGLLALAGLIICLVGYASFILDPNEERSPSVFWELCKTFFVSTFID